MRKKSHFRGGSDAEEPHEGESDAGKPVAGLPGFLRGNSRRALLALALIFILGLGLRLYGISEKIQAPDEDVTLARLSGFTAAPVESPAPDFNPPLYYLLVAPAYLIAPGLASVRLMGALFGALTVLVIFFLAGEFMGENKSLLAAFLFAIYPYSIVYSQQARNYALAVLLFAIATLFWVRFLKGKNSARALLPIYAAMLYTHYVLIFGVLAHAAITFFLKGSSGAESRKYLFSVAVVALLAVPLLLLIVMQGGQTGLSNSAAASFDSRAVLNYFRQGVGIDYGFYFGNAYGIYGRPVPKFMVPAAACWALVFLGLFALWRKREDFFILAGTYFLVAFVALVGGMFSTFLAQPHYLLFITPVFLLFIVRGTNFKSIPRTVLFLLVVGGWLQAILFYYSHLPNLHYIGLP
ncbi:MAG: glycosyltransferase family 39 protein [Candidatus Diapherotrites archaeon]